MKLQKPQNITVNTQYKAQKQAPAFKGASAVAASALNFLQTNPGVGASAVDACCMCLPRTVVDAKERGPQAGIETGIREFSSNINDGLMGAYALGAGSLLAKGFKKEFDVNANKLTIDNAQLDILTEFKNEAGNIKNADNMKSFLNKVFDNTEVFSPNQKEIKNGYVKISEKTQKEVVEKLSNALIENKDEKSLKETKNFIKSALTVDTGAETGYKLSKKIGEANLSSTSTLDTYIDDITNMTKAFMKGKVLDSNNQVKKEFISKLKGFNLSKSILGIALTAAIGFSVQPINTKLTELRTGKKGFVGGGEKDDSTGFKILKTGAAATAGILALVSITRKPSELAKKLQFKGFWPSLNQFKFVYGTTIASRLLFSRNKNELREGAIKDSLGFTNWLILPGLVQNLAARGFEKVSGQKLVKKATEGNAFKRFLNSEVISRNEVMKSALGSKCLEKGSTKFIEMYKKLPKDAKSKMLMLTGIQLIGYLYSGLVLGIGIPKFNMAMTKYFAQKEAQKAQNTEKAA